MRSISSREIPACFNAVSINANGLVSRRRAESARDAFHELSFARAEIAAQADDPTALCLASPLLADGEGLFRAVRNECSHECSKCGRHPYRANAIQVPR